MRPFTAEFARRELLPQSKPIKIRGKSYLADIEAGCVWEMGPQGKKAYRIAHVMGGKNVYFFLTPFERGRLQVLPVAFNVRKRLWYDTTASMVRHALDIPDQALDWREWPLTFNTACYGCHVSQLETNYDLQTDTYHTTWAEPGINCETCHGPAAEHVAVCEAAAREGRKPEDLKIIRTKHFTTEQINSLCASCHAKLRPITDSFRPGELFFDHFGLSTLEDRDFYPDGRDLGENYTYTLWLMSPCVKSGKLDCMHCHTSSGRYRFKEKNPDGACLPCHSREVADPRAHTHHEPESEGSRCIACHMPMTEFAMMRRSDHSMRAPAPAATLAFRSPNACNMCHSDKDAAWADKWVRKWYARDYQAPILEVGRLVDAARKSRWSEFPAVLAYLQRKDRDQVVAASLLRLIAACPEKSKWPVIRKAARDPSPLVRAAAAYALGFEISPENRKALVGLAGDRYRLVRVEAAAALSAFRIDDLEEEKRAAVDRATAEYIASLKTRRDDPIRHYNLGNFYFNRGELKKAVECFETAVRLRPDTVPALVNAALAYARLGENAKAERYLKRALKADPANAVANFNMGLLLAEKGNLKGAEKHLRQALKTDPRFPEAAYNLGVLLAAEKPEEAIKWCRKAAELNPQEPKYAYSLGFYLKHAGYSGEAVVVLRRLIRRHPDFPDAYALLGVIYKEQGDVGKAAEVFRQAAEDPRLPDSERLRFQAFLRALNSEDR